MKNITHLEYNSLLTVDVNLFVRHNVAATANNILYIRTILKLPSHSIFPKFPIRSKFVIPENINGILINTETKQKVRSSFMRLT